MVPQSSQYNFGCSKPHKCPEKVLSYFGIQSYDKRWGRVHTCRLGIQATTFFLHQNFVILWHTNVGWANRGDSAQQIKHFFFSVHSELINAKFVNWIWWLPPPSSLVFISLHHISNISQAFPLHFCILQVFKNWSQARPGEEATLPPPSLPHFLKLIPPPLNPTNSHTWMSLSV